MICPRCESDNHSMMAFGEEAATPAAGDVSVCARCAFVGIFTGVGIELREPSAEEREQLLEEEDVRRAVEAIVAFNLKDSTDRVRFDCGCRMGTRHEVFYFLPCSSTCDKYAYAIEQGRKMGKPLDVMDFRR